MHSTLVPAGTFTHSFPDRILIVSRIAVPAPREWPVMTSRYPGRFVRDSMIICPHSLRILVAPRSIPWWANPSRNGISSHAKSAMASWMLWNFNENHWQCHWQGHLPLFPWWTRRQTWTTRQQIGQTLDNGSPVQGRPRTRKTGHPLFLAIQDFSWSKAWFQCWTWRTFWERIDRFSYSPKVFKRNN